MLLSSTQWPQRCAALFRVCVTAAACLFVPVVHGQEAVSLQTLNVDLTPLVESLGDSPTRFAVPIRASADLTRSGRWTESGGLSRWRHSMRVPSAVSMSLLADRINLPRGAVLKVSNGEVSFQYTADDIIQGRLWSRLVRGDRIDLELTVPTTLRGSARLVISELQAGYRAISRGQRNHPSFDRMRRSRLGLRTLSLSPLSGGADDACRINYRCEETPENAGPAKASVALVIANQYQCSGTLVNNARQDGIPYILTARHCQGSIAGGAPPSAAAVTVYWQAMSSCNEELGDLFNPFLVTQTGAVTVVEQQDAWLVRLNSSPRIANPYFAGVNASGSGILGGYSSHHALSTRLQFTAWHGNAVEVNFPPGSFGADHAWDLWGVSQQRGYFGPGASGSALFDQSHLLAGVASLGRDDAGRLGSCPAANPVEPTASTAKAYFVSLARLWSSTADTTSSTGSATLAAVLDPDATGMSVIAGADGLPSLHLYAVTPEMVVNGMAQLQWNGGPATSCVASGGVAGDGWAGNRPAQGTAYVSSATIGAVSYVMRCHYAGGREIESTTSVLFRGPDPYARFVGVRSNSVWVGAPFRLTWDSNQGPCTLTTATDSLERNVVSSQTGLPSSGTTVLLFDQVRTMYFGVECGEAVTPANVHGYVDVVAPSVEYVANSTIRRVGQPLRLRWRSIAATCATSGGAPFDGWSGAQGEGIGNRPASTQQVGDFAYTLTCSAGTVQVARSINVSVRDEAPFVTLTLPNATVHRGTFYTLQLRSNIDGCRIFGIPGMAIASLEVDAESTLSLTAHPLGIHTLHATCSSGGVDASSEPVTLEIITPPAPVAPKINMTVSPRTVEVGQDVSINWTTENATSCTAFGHPSFSGPVATAGTQTIRMTTIGNPMLDLNCIGIQLGSTVGIAVTVTAAAGEGGGGSGTGGGGTGGGGTGGGGTGGGGTGGGGTGGGGTGGGGTGGGGTGGGGTGGGGGGTGGSTDGGGGGSAGAELVLVFLFLLAVLHRRLRSRNRGRARRITPRYLR